MEELQTTPAAPQEHPSVMPMMQEQSTALADKIVIHSLNTIPKEIYDYFWAEINLDHMVNNYTDRDIALLEFQILQSFLNILGYIPLRDLRKPVELTIPREKIKYKKIEENGETALMEDGKTIEYQTYVLKNIYWDMLMHKLTLRATTMAKRSRGGFTMEKITSHKSIQGFSMEQQQPPKKGNFF